jgi:nitrite reductase/ring-hydroxylating ferredoxin subunit
MERIRFPGVAPPEIGTSVRVDVRGHPVAVFNVGGKLWAIDARCPHRGGPLEKGNVADGIVTCPWHGSQFSIENGAVLRGPANNPLRSYSTQLEGETLVVEVP